MPGAKRLPVFGIDASRNWAWNVELSPAYVGYGMIMNPLTTAHMILGAIIGWGFLSPLAQTKGWAPGPVESWDTGSQGWTIWVALGIILGDSLVGISWICLQFLLSEGESHLKWTQLFRHQWARTRSSRSSPELVVHAPDRLRSDDGSLPNEHSPMLPESNSRVRKLDADSAEDMLSWKTLASWFVSGTLLCFLTTQYLFQGLITSWQLIISIALILPLGIASIRSMGETDNSLASSLGWHCPHHGRFPTTPINSSNVMNRQGVSATLRDNPPTVQSKCDHRLLARWGYIRGR